MIQNGTVLNGRYEVLDELEVHRTCRLYEGADHATNEQVRLRLELVNADGTQRAVLEELARRIARLHHRSVSRLRDLVFTRDGRPLLVLDPTARLTFRAALQHRPLTVPEIERGLLGALEGLAVLHEAGLLHGDVCAETLVIAPAHATREIMLEPNARWFGVGSPPLFPGSADLRAPECSEAGADSIGPSADLYSWALLAFELLGHPLIANSLAATSGGEGVPRALAEAIIEAARPIASERPDSARDLLAAIPFPADPPVLFMGLPFRLDSESWVEPADSIERTVPGLDCPAQTEDMLERLSPQAMPYDGDADKTVMEMAPPSSLALARAISPQGEEERSISRRSLPLGPLFLTGLGSGSLTISAADEPSAPLGPGVLLWVLLPVLAFAVGLYFGCS